MVVARLEGTKDISELLEKLRGLEYEVASSNNKVGYVSRNNASGSDLSRDVKSVKTACKFTGSIKCNYGTSSSTY